MAKTTSSPHCQHHESWQWLERQIRKQVPAEYFLLTFTLPAEFRALAWAQQTVVYDSLLRCSWETVRTFSLNDRQLQGYARGNRGTAYEHAPAGLSPACASGHAGGGG